MKAVIGLLCLLSIVCADQFGFSLQYRGVCTFGASTNCDMRASTQTIQTNISPDGTVTEDISTVLGALSQGFMTIDSMGNFNGNTTFGIHTTHANHSLTFSGFTTPSVSEVDAGLQCFAGAGLITSGVGAWAGATGAISFSGCTDPTIGYTTAILVSRVFIPAAPAPPMKQ